MPAPQGVPITRHLRHLSALRLLGQAQILKACPDTNREFFRSLLGGTVLELERGALLRPLVSLARLSHRRGRPGNFWNLVQLKYARVGDFPTEGLNVALLLVALFEEDRLA